MASTIDNRGQGRIDGSPALSPRGAGRCGAADAVSFRIDVACASAREATVRPAR